MFKTITIIQYTSSVTSLIDTLGWPTLAERRLKTRLIMMYKITHALIAIPNNILIPTDSRTRKSDIWAYNNTKRYIQLVIFSTHYSTMEHLATDNYLKSIYRLFQRTANTRCSLKHLNIKYNCTYNVVLNFCFIHT